MSDVGTGKLLRPFSGFDATYAGKSCRLPIMLTEGGVALDALAGQSGYDPNLIAALSVPFGAKILLYLPAIVPFGEWLPESTTGLYSYMITWRLRSLSEHQRVGGSWHVPKSTTGAPDGASKRFQKLAAFGVYEYVGAEPDAPAASYPVSYTDVCVDAIRVNATSQTQPDVTFPYRPLLPAGTTGHYQQGVVTTSTSISPYDPAYIVKEVMALGDEMMIGLFRDADSATWDFDGADLPVKELITQSAMNGIWAFVAGTTS